MTFECFEDKENPGDWRVEGLDKKSGEVFIALFHGFGAETRARQYFFFVTEGR
jgi:hypothetical protein